MLTLVLSNAEPPSEPLPETLLLDTARIAAIRADFARILNMLVIVNTIDITLVMSRLPDPERVAFLDRVATVLATDADALAENCDDLIAAIGPTGHAILLYQIASSVRPNHTVRLATTHHFPALCMHKISHRWGAADPLTGPPIPAPLAPLVDAAIARFDVLCAANHLLHTPTYDRLMRAAAGLA
jgi:hypothetical protein